MALNAYLQRVRLLLADANFTRYNDFDIASFCNSARGQIAGEAECIRVYATLAVSSVAQQYAFTTISLGGAAGVAGVLNVRMASFSLPGATGQIALTPREWEFFNSFVLSQPAPTAGQPSIWAQFGQGVNGTLFVNLLDTAYTLALDTVCYPSDLTTNSDAEAIPYLWTDAIPYYAAYLAMLTAQNMAGADAMYKLYQVFVARARGFATPSVLPHQYEQAPSPTTPNQLGVTMKAAG